MKDFIFGIVAIGAIYILMFFVGSFITMVSWNNSLALYVQGVNEIDLKAGFWVFLFVANLFTISFLSTTKKK